jgi:hypothetical protein
LDEAVTLCTAQQQGQIFNHQDGQSIRVSTSMISEIGVEFTAGHGTAQRGL